MARTTDTRERLLDATLHLIWDESLGKASVDAICERAEVRKGSFYHFFKSKEDLVATALENHFQVARVDFDRVFSPSVPPVDRLRGFFDLVVRKQQMKADAVGRVVGCPYGSAAAASSPEDKLVHDAVKDIMATWKKYIETTVRDGVADGSIPKQDVAEAVQTLFDYVEGTMMAGRIQNSMDPIKKMARVAFKLLGLEWEASPIGAAKA